MSRTTVVRVSAEPVSATIALPTAGHACLDDGDQYEFLALIFQEALGQVLRTSDGPYRRWECVREWGGFRDDGGAQPYSFAELCAGLGLDAQAVRQWRREVVMIRKAGESPLQTGPARYTHVSNRRVWEVPPRMLPPPGPRQQRAGKRDVRWTARSRR